MEWTSVKEMNMEVNQTVTNGLRLCYASCCHDLQIQEQHRQHALLEKLDKYRDQAVEEGNEEQANAAYINLNIVEAALNYIQLWLLVKDDRMEEAWDQLVDAQRSLECALKFIRNDLLQRLQMELLALERLLFPPQQFVSSSLYFGFAECTICDKVYGECDHVAGRLYMGKMCAKRVREIGNVDHVALVDSPLDKGCRRTKVKRDGYMYCTLTYRQMEEAGDDRGDAELLVIRSR